MLHWVLQPARLSVRLSVCRVPTIYSIYRKAVETSNLVETWLGTRVTEKKIEAKRSQVKVTGNENVKIVFFAHIYVKSGSICHLQLADVNLCELS